MDTEGTHDARNTRSDQVPRPAAPPDVPPRPSAPPHFAAPAPAADRAPGSGTSARAGDAPQSSFMAWLSAPRVLSGPGIWAFEHKPRPKEEPRDIAVPQLIAGAVISFLCAWLIWSLLMNDYLGPYWKWPREVMLPDAWKTGNANIISSFVYMALVLGAIVIVFGRVGRWPTLFRRLLAPPANRVWDRLPAWLAPKDPASLPGGQLIARAAVTLLLVWFLWQWCIDQTTDSSLLMLQLEKLTPASGQYESYFYYATSYSLIDLGVLLAVFSRFACLPELRRRYGPPSRRAASEARKTADSTARVLPVDQAEWTALRTAGAPAAADRLAHEARSGLMNDVDHARISRAWQSVRAQPGRLQAFVDSVQEHGAAACLHPSGARDLTTRTARHDLLTSQVRIGTASEDVRNPYERRGTGCALEPDVLGTSLLAVGPPGSGKTTRLVRPLVEALCLQALAGRAAVVSLGTAASAPASEDAFDAVIRIGHPDAECDLDLYGGTTDPDEAAGMLAEALVGDVAATLPAGDVRRAATVLGQLLGPFRVAHGRFPGVAELRELLDGSREAMAGLRATLEAAGENGALRELDARERQADRPGDAGVLLADRIALLDRPAFAGFFDPTGRSRQVSLRALDHPLRVRIDLPERGHTEASRILARLVLAQFSECAVARSDRSVFACLVLDDASHVITQEALRGLQRLRSANAGAVLTLRSLDDVPEPLRGALLGAVGCRMAFAGVTTWDGARFAEVWGKAWVETRDVTDRQIVSDEPFTKLMHSIRRLVTGKNVTAKAVTVRTVERERWSASDLANSVPPGHAVLSVTSVAGEHAPPVLVDLRS
ncbi:ATP/GTP-binding protein [Streptomyces sp. ID38640]|uniref:ATP/GTP-binding protein n=1 Tax=Streptomyces sp. ID38640 TaxID=1265399 RepID=UPI00140EE88F|nr:ATP/GTP-binding protein [Streptomyces sp. ID38640]QIK11192.1 ATP/GTP-binding protein [Streptomyces sp. ID38640]